MVTQRSLVRALRRLLPLAVIAGALAAPAGASAVPTISIANDSVIEGLDNTIVVTRSGTVDDLDSTSEVPYATANHTALFPDDYGNASDDDGSGAGSPLFFDPGETQRTVSVPTVGDTLHEGDEFYFVDFGTPVNATYSGSASATVTIVDDDDPPPQPPPANPTTPPCMQLACAAFPPSLLALFGPDFSQQLEAAIRKSLFGGGGLFGLTGIFPLLGNFNSIILATLGRLGGKSASSPIATASKTITQPGAQQVTYTLTKQGKKLRKKRKARLTVTMTFTDIAGATVTDSIPVQFKNKKKKRKK